MGKNHDHSISKTAKEAPLIYALVLTAGFMIAEVVGGFMTGSLALISDAAHMLTDVTAMIIALVAIRIGRRPADEMRTFGYYRFEILAAAFNTLMLFFVAIYILYSAYERLRQPPEIFSTGMLIIAILGLLVNFISMKLLLSSKDKSLNMKGAYLEVWSDMLGSVGVIIAALIIRFTNWAWVDSLIAVIIGFWVLPRAWQLMRESINILLEGVPEGIDIAKLKNRLCSVEGVINIHELHIWAITNDKISLTAHVVIDDKANCDTVLQNLRDCLANEFAISHTTLQHERSNCIGEKNVCQF